MATGKASVSLRDALRKASASGECSKTVRWRLETCQSIIGYRFRDEKLLQEALTFRSGPSAANKRLAIVGDRIVGSFMAERWYYWADKNLGRLAWGIAQNESLSNRSLRDTGFHLGLGECTLPRSLVPDPPPADKRQALQRVERHLMADTVEALIGGVWLDSNFDRDAMLALIDRMGLVHHLMLFPTMRTRKALPEEFFHGNASVYKPLPFSGVQFDLERQEPLFNKPITLSRLGHGGKIHTHKLKRLKWVAPLDSLYSNANARTRLIDLDARRIPPGSRIRQGELELQDSGWWSWVQKLLWGEHSAKRASSTNSISQTTLSRARVNVAAQGIDSKAGEQNAITQNTSSNVAAKVKIKDDTASAPHASRGNAPLSAKSKIKGRPDSGTPVARQETSRLNSHSALKSRKPKRVERVVRRREEVKNAMAELTALRIAQDMARRHKREMEWREHYKKAHAQRMAVKAQTEPQSDKSSQVTIRRLRDVPEPTRTRQEQQQQQREKQQKQDLQTQGVRGGQRRGTTMTTEMTELEGRLANLQRRLRQLS